MNESPSNKETKNVNITHGANAQVEESKKVEAQNSASKNANSPAPITRGIVSNGNSCS